MSKREQIGLVVVVVLLLGGLVGFSTLTQSGIGTSPDSVVYVGAARNLLDGQGLSVPFGDTINAPLTHHAPLYSLLLAAGGFFGMELLPAARWLNALLFVGNGLLLGAILVRVGGGRLWLAGVGMVLALTAIPLLTIHAMAWTEPLFLFLAFSGFLLIDHYLERGRRRSLVGAGLLLGLALLVRYAGVTLVATGLLVIALGAGDRSFRQRAADVALFGVASSFLTGIWLLRNVAIAGTTTNRALIVHPPSMEEAWQAVFTVSSWLLVPAAVPGAARVGLWLLVLAVLAVLFVLRWRKSQESAARYFLRGADLPPLVRLLLLFLAIYVAFVLLSLSFLDANIPLDNRIFSPVYATLLILFPYFGSELILLVGRGLAAKGVSLLLTLFLALHVVSGVSWAQTARGWGGGLSDETWQQSPTVVRVRQLPAGTTILTNAPEALYLHTGRPSQLLPRKVESATQQVNVDYRHELEQVKGRVEQEGAVVVYFTRLERTTLVSEGELRELLVGYTPLETADGLIYGAEMLGDS